MRKMLVVDPKKRIEWSQLFQHKVNFIKEEEIKQDLENTLNMQDMNISMNMSRFYIKNNKVISHPADIKEKEQVNEFAINIAKQANQKNGTSPNPNTQLSPNHGKQEFTGKCINRQTKREEPVESSN